jgi:hypothetical protein
MKIEMDLAKSKFHEFSNWNESGRNGMDILLLIQDIIPGL